MLELGDIVRADVADRRPVDARERESIEDFVRRFDVLAHPFSENADRVHVTASAILVTTDRRRVLLHLHKRLNLWLQPGGHIDDGETPWDAAVREASEEAGLPASLVPGAALGEGAEDGAGEAERPPLVHVDVHSGGRKHVHLDLRYLVEAPHQPPSPPEGESQQVEWFQWHQAIAMADPGLVGVLRALQPGTPSLRTARASDARESGDVYLRSRRFGLPQIPIMHSDSDVRRWMADELVGRTDMWVADLDGVVVGLMVLGHERDGDWVEHLYLDPSWMGRGLGDRFVELAKRRCAAGLELWAFQSNEGARRFYERHGFVAEEFTEGQANEERMPDVRYRWTPRPT